MIIGLTGGIASGKSTVSDMIRKLDIPIVDADVEARMAVEPGEPAFEEIVKAFGKQVLDETGHLNRPTLGDIVFQNEEKRQQLNKIVHPQVRHRMKQQLHQLQQTHPHVVLDIPLLFESKLTDWADRVLVVYVDEGIQLNRLMERNNYSESEAKSRIQSQLPLTEKKALADAVIDNNGSLEDSRKQLITIFRKWEVL